jgi:REP element-mobilizing transposase RayT
MPRIARFLRENEPTIYHVISRTALDGLPFKDTDKEYLVELIKKWSRIFFVDVLGFAIMGNHFHLVVRMYPESEVSNEEVKKRYMKLYDLNRPGPEMELEKFKKKLCSLSWYVKEIKQGFSRYFNKKYGRKGFLWGDRFKSLIVEDGLTLVNLLAYVDLNPVRAGIVKRPEEYRWCSLGYHIQSGNKDKLLSVDFGMKEWNEFDEKEIVRKYREFVYETGAIDTGKGAVIAEEMVAEERKKGFRLKRVELFRYRCRYFTDAGVLGSKRFVREVFEGIKGLLGSKRERQFVRVIGDAGVYSLKRLQNVSI